MGNAKDKDVKGKNSEEPRLVKYHEHGILSKVVDFRTDVERWVFKSQSCINEMQGVNLELTTLLDDLSKEGYELVCYSDEERGYIFRSVDKAEDYWI